MFWRIARALVVTAGLVWLAVALTGALSAETLWPAEDLPPPAERGLLIVAEVLLALCLLWPPARLASSPVRYVVVLCFGGWITVPLVFLTGWDDAPIYLALMLVPIGLATLLLIREWRAHLSPDSVAI